MLHIVKDAINPFNWFKIILNPSKFIKVFNDRINYYPGLKFGYAKSKIIKKIYMTFNIFFAKKNNNFKEYFFSEQINDLKTVKSFSLNEDYLINETHLQHLKETGVLVLENVLPENEHQKILEDFSKFKNKIYDNDLSDYKNKNLSVRKYKNVNKYMYTVDSLEQQKTKLKFINDQITKKIYGISLDPSISYGFFELLDLPETAITGDNTWHADRYLPNLKLLYFPNRVDNNGAPFRYSLGTHKINKDYLNFFLNKESGGTIESKEEKEKFLKHTHEFVVPPNTLVATLTNGFHGRTPFKIKGERCALFLMYKKFNLWSLISYWNYNRS